MERAYAQFVKEWEGVSGHLLWPMECSTESFMCWIGNTTPYPTNKYHCLSPEYTCNHINHYKISLEEQMKYLTNLKETTREKKCLGRDKKKKKE